MKIFRNNKTGELFKMWDNKRTGARTRKNILTKEVSIERCVVGFNKKYSIAWEE
jgi:hypothetical protein